VQGKIEGSSRVGLRKGQSCTAYSMKGKHTVIPTDADFAKVCIAVRASVETGGVTEVSMMLNTSHPT
jgi:hypothetical protein